MTLPEIKSAFRLTNAQIAAITGRSVRTVDEYIREHTRRPGAADQLAAELRKLLNIVLTTSLARFHNRSAESQLIDQLFPHIRLIAAMSTIDPTLNIGTELQKFAAWMLSEHPDLLSKAARTTLKMLAK